MSLWVKTDQSVSVRGCFWFGTEAVRVGGSASLLPPPAVCWSILLQRVSKVKYCGEKCIRSAAGSLGSLLSPASVAERWRTWVPSLIESAVVCCHLSPMSWGIVRWCCCGFVQSLDKTDRKPHTWSPCWQALLKKGKCAEQSGSEHHGLMPQ